MRKHRSPPCSAALLEKESRSKVRIVHSDVGVKSWSMGPPSCDAVRPPHCPACGAASREPGRALVVVGHGFRARTIEGPLAPNEKAVLTEISARRYDCRACNAILVVVPRGIARCYRYALNAIAWALSLWAYECATGPVVRARVSTARAIGVASATRWRSLSRWTHSASAIFGAVPKVIGTTRERAARIASFIAGKAPLSRGPVALDAFFGAAFCGSS